MLKKNPLERISLEDVLNNDWILGNDSHTQKKRDRLSVNGSPSAKFAALTRSSFSKDERIDDML